MPQRDGLYLADIVLAAREVAEWLNGVERDRWSTDSMLRTAVAHNLMIMGEAASSLSEDARATMPAVPWRGIRAFRNTIVHRYFALDWDIVWKIAHEDAPEAAASIEPFLRRDYPDIAKRLDDTSD